MLVSMSKMNVMWTVSDVSPSPWRRTRLDCLDLGAEFAVPSHQVVISRQPGKEARSQAEIAGESESGVRCDGALARTTAHAEEQQRAECKVGVGNGSRGSSTSIRRNSFPLTSDVDQHERRQ